MASWDRYKEPEKYKSKADTNVNPKHVGESLRVLTMDARLELRRISREQEKKRKTSLAAGTTGLSESDEDDVVLPPKSSPKSQEIEDLEDDDMITAVVPDCLEVVDAAKASEAVVQDDCVQEVTESIVQDVVVGNDVEKVVSTDILDGEDGIQRLDSGIEIEAKVSRRKSRIASRKQLDEGVVGVVEQLDAVVELDDEKAPPATNGVTPRVLRKRAMTITEEDGEDEKDARIAARKARRAAESTVLE